MLQTGLLSEPRNYLRKAPKTGSQKATFPEDQKPGSYAFDCYAKHYEAKDAGPSGTEWRTYMRNQRVIRPYDADIDAFFAGYLNNPNQFYVQKAHPLSIARIDVQKLHTELLTGMRLSSHKARQFELVAENADVIKQHLARKYGK